jgi:hypothetical protein
MTRRGKRRRARNWIGIAVSPFLRVGLIPQLSNTPSDDHSRDERINSYAKKNQLRE